MEQVLAHSSNTTDLICFGAEPIGFLKYIILTVNPVRLHNHAEPTPIP